jgi:antitoxin Phd
MNANQWRLQDAKTQLSQVVEVALHGEPQHIIRNGKKAVVVLSEQAFELYSAVPR